MKNTIKALLVFIGTFPILVHGQSAFDQLEDSEKIGTVTISKGMLGIVANMSIDNADEETQEFLDLAKSIKEIKVFISEDKTASQKMKATAKGYIQSSKMESLMKVKDEGSEVNFYVMEGKDSDHVSEMVMLVTDMDKKSGRSDFETVLVTMTGDIDLTKIGSLVNKMNLPKDLKKVEKKK
ncbi:MAG: DUF4252 domain-containing protein [Bacteroidota bacterium]